MASRHLSRRLSFAKMLSAAIGAAAIAGLVSFGFVTAPRVRAQSPSPRPPQWQKDAGGKMAFDVASVKRDTAPFSVDTVHTNVQLGAGDAFSPTGGLFSATNRPLSAYMIFAYKLTPTQTGEILDQLPKWNITNRYDIEARATGNPTKDQYRLMMQSLLADRFKLMIHYETKQLPVLALVLDKPGKLGPKLRQHSTDIPCPTASPIESGIVATVAGGFPEPCGAFEDLPSTTQGRYIGGARNVPMSLIASTFSAGLFRTFKPVVDRTGLSGNYDFVIDFSPGLPFDVPLGSNLPADPNGPTFLEALKDQLGLRLESTKGPVDTIVIDHVEEPSQN